MSGMRLGLCEWVSPVAGPAACRVAAEAGLDGVQVDLGGGERRFPLSDGTVQRYYIEAAARWGVALCSLGVNGLYPHTLLHPEEEAERAAVRGILQRAVEAAAAMSIPLIQIPSFYDNAMEDEARRAATAEYLRIACDLAAARGILVASENTLTAGENLDLVGRVNRPNFRIYFDIENAVFFRGEDPAAAIRALGGHIGEIHVKDGTAQALSSRALGEGHARFHACMQAMRDIGYSGWVILENNYDRAPLCGEHDDRFEILRRDVERLKDAIGA